MSASCGTPDGRMSREGPLEDRGDDAAGVSDVRSDDDQETNQCFL